MWIDSATSLTAFTCTRWPTRTGTSTPEGLTVPPAIMIAIVISAPVAEGDDPADVPPDGAAGANADAGRSATQPAAAFRLSRITTTARPRRTLIWMNLPSRMVLSEACCGGFRFLNPVADRVTLTVAAKLV